MTQATKPNILLVMTDQHRPDHTGFGGNTVVQTPNLDALASTSVRFDRAFVANPICMPNRASIFTSRMPSLHGTRYNGIALDWRVETFPRALKNAGYHTAHLGKCHLQNMNIMASIARKQTDRMTPGDAISLAHYPQGWDQYENLARHARERVTMPDDYYGFAEVDLVVAHSDQCGGHYYQWLKDQGVDPASIQGASGAYEYDSPSHMTRKTRTPVELYPTSYITDVTSRFLQERSKQPQTPFMAVVSYPDPHHPFTPPGKYFDMYDQESIPTPDAFHHPADKLPPHVANLHGQREDGSVFKDGVMSFACTEQEARGAIALNYGSITMIDDAIGQVLAKLEELGMADNTIVIFTSDHGDYMGDHQLLLKGAIHYQGLIRVGCVWMDPRSSDAGRTSDQLCGTIDLPTSILDRAGVEGFNGMQGKVLPDIADGKDGYDSLVIEEDQRRSLMGFPPHYRVRSLVTDRYRLSMYSCVEWGELYDLHNDPNEFENLWDDPSHAGTRAELTERLARRLIDLADSSPFCTGHGP